MWNLYNNQTIFVFSNTTSTTHWREMRRWKIVLEILGDIWKAWGTVDAIKREISSKDTSAHGESCTTVGLVKATELWDRFAALLLFTVFNWPLWEWTQPPCWARRGRGRRREGWTQTGRLRYRLQTAADLPSSHTSAPPAPTSPLTGRNPALEGSNHV